MTDPSQERLEIEGMTDTGRQRSANEDSYRIVASQNLALICDGMGGHENGQIASSLAARTICEHIDRFAHRVIDRPGDMDDETCVTEEEDVKTAHDHAGANDTPLADATDPDGTDSRSSLTPAGLIREAVELANRRIVGANHERNASGTRGMGTTVVGFWAPRSVPGAFVFHAGDSRLYRFRDGQLEALTRDHSLYQAWLDAGSQGNAPARNVIIRALGAMAEVRPDITRIAIEPEDLFLACSDGLTTMMDDVEIADRLRVWQDEPPASICRRLIDEANDRGGKDNVSVIVIRAGG